MRKFLFIIIFLLSFFITVNPSFAEQEKKPSPVKEQTPAPVKEALPAPTTGQVTPAAVTPVPVTPAPAQPVPMPHRQVTEEVTTTVGVTVESVEGTARLQPAGTNEWTALKPGASLSVGDTISVYAGSKVNLKFEDESTTTINENSIFTVKELKKEVVPETKTEVKELNFNLWLGKTTVKTKKLGPKDKFEIHTPAAVCSVRGTDFSVEVDESKVTKVKVYDGIVSVREATGIGEEVLVRKNQQTIVKPQTVPTLPEEIPPEKAELPAKPAEPAKPALPAKPGEKPAKPAEPAKPAAPPAAKKGLGMSMGGNFGAVTLTDPVTGKQKVYSQISLQPEFSIGKFGIGLDLYFYFDEKNNLREQDWNEWSDALTKIMYVRYGQKREPVYVYLGVFPGVTLGHGLIMSRYSNMLGYPDVRKIGFELDLDLGVWGFESIVTDLDRVELFGGRTYFRPLYRSGSPLLRKLALGVSGVTDLNPDAKSETRDGIIIYGADLDLPIVEKSAFSLIAFVDGAQISLGERYDVSFPSHPKSGGWGYAFGFMGNTLKLINYRLEYRGSRENFISSYFDTYYENERAEKPWNISSKEEPGKRGFYGEIGFNLLNKVNFVLNYENYDLDPQKSYPLISSELIVDPSLLMNKYSFSFTYTKKNVDELKDLFELESPNVVMTTKIGYQVAGGVFLIFTRKRTFDQNHNPIETTNIETRMKF